MPKVPAPLPHPPPDMMQGAGTDSQAERSSALRCADPLRGTRRHPRVPSRRRGLATSAGQRMALLAFALGALALAGGCGDVRETGAPDISVTPAPLVLPSIQVGEEVQRTLTVRNVGSASLRVDGIRLEITSPYLTLETPTPFRVEPGEAQVVVIAYRPQGTLLTEGQVIFTTNAPNARDFAVPVEAGPLGPQLLVSPTQIGFGTVGEGLRRSVDVTVVNTGLAPLVLCDAYFEAGLFFEHDLEEVLTERFGGYGAWPGLAPLTEDRDPTDSRLTFRASFLPARIATERDTLVLVWDRRADPSMLCDDAASLERTSVAVEGEGASSELLLEPCPVAFGERPVGFTSRRTVSLRNVGNLPMRLLSLRLDPERTSDSFSLAALPPLPQEIASADPVVFDVVYDPPRLAAEAGVLEIEYQQLDEDGTPLGDVERQECPISAVAVERRCPEAVPRGSMREDPNQRRSANISWAVPLQTLLLDGRDSFSPDGRPLDFEWVIVEQPRDSIQGLRPSSVDPGDDALREFFLPITGRYVFELRLTDDLGVENCEPAFVTVTATPSRTVSIELTWRNPTDPDETDNIGSDLDLHFVKIGPGRWFDTRWDTFFGNKAPDWDPERPSLDFDVTEGRGPETITMDNPQDCQWYAVGVHYFRERYATAFANVRIFIDGELRWERLNVPLRREWDFWDVGRLHWPTGEFFETASPPRVVSNFNPAERVAPPSTPEIDASGLCGDFP